MIRDRAWRRHIEEKYVIKRLKKICLSNRWYFENVNGNRSYYPRITDYIGTKDYFLSKTLSTPPWDSHYKAKYSPNRAKSHYYRDKKPSENSLGLREKDKVLFLKILRENGLK